MSHRATAAAATERNEFSDGCLDALGSETGGNSVALDCLCAAFDASQITDKVLAGELGVSRGQLSKIRNGIVPFPMALLDKLRPAIRHDWLHRMNEREDHDAMAYAVEQLVKAAVQWLRIASVQRKKMAKAGL